MTPGLRNVLTVAVAAALIAAFLGQGWCFITTSSQTFDEAAHLTAGYSYLATGDFRLNHEDPPLIKLWHALPVYLLVRVPFSPDAELWAANDEWRIGRDFLHGSGVSPMTLLVPARAAGLLLGAALVGLVGWWAYRLWGRLAALLSMAFAAFDPNLIAHAGTISTDVGVTLFMVLTVYLFWEYVRRPSHGLLIGVGASLGLALASKFTALFLLPVLAVVTLSHLLLGGSLKWPGQEDLSPQSSFASRLRQTWGPAARILTIAAVVLPLVYLGYGFPHWAHGLRYQIERKMTGEPSYFLCGDISSEGWWSYYPIAFVLKTPLGTLSAIVAALVTWRFGPRLRGRDAAFLLVPAGLLFLAMVLGRVNLGVRYLLPVYPFLFVLTGRLAATHGWKTVVFPLLAWCLAAWTAVSSLSQLPHPLAYFNELYGGPDHGGRVLSDSNLDWGQDLPALKSFMEREQIDRVYLSYFGTADPAAYGIDYVAMPGFGSLQPPPDVSPPTGRQLLAISVVNLQGIYLREHRDLYRWLDQRTPVARLGHSIYVYDLTDDPEGRERLSARGP